MLATGLVALPLLAPLLATSPQENGAPSGHQRMLAALKGILERTNDENWLLGDVKVREGRAKLAALKPEAPAPARFAVLVELGDALVYYGNEREGLAVFAEAFQLPREGIPNGPYQDAKIRYAAAWLRLAETENCCADYNAESCILPLRGPAQHKKPEGSRNALKLLGEVLADTKPRTPTHLKAKWFYSVTAMTLGEYPEKVPEELRIPPAFFEGDEAFPRFANVATKLGLDIANLAGGVIADDFDNDDDIDILMTGYGSDGQLEYFRNEGDGTFTRRTKEAGIVGLFGGLNMIQGDYDNDGFVDVFIPRGAWLGKDGLHPDSLLHNQGDGTFVDRAYEAGIAGNDFPNVTGVFTDHDNDGDLDLYVGNDSSPELRAPCQLYRNKGDGTFEDVAAQAGVTNDRFTRGVIAGDYDGDGWQDLYVSNLGQENRLYRNKGDGTFEDVAPQLGLTGPSKSYPSWFFDVDNDGALDLQVNPFGASPADLTAAALGMPFEADLPALYRGDGKGGFTSVGKEFGLTEPYSAMGANIGDLDNDGFLDFVAGTGRPEARDLVPNKAYHNKGGKAFADITLPSGLGHLQKGHGTAFADLDADGDLDVFAQMGGAFRSDLFHNACFENP
ncbi:MAG TPA: VCBS repeat-containing protein, partial [Planctomycetota bacterium]